MILLVRLFLNALALMVVALLVPGVSVHNFPAAFVAAIILGLINALIRPILQILSLPITVLTLGLFALVINALMFWLAANISPGFTVANFSAAFWGALVFTVISWMTNGLIGGGLQDAKKS